MLDTKNVKKNIGLNILMKPVAMILSFVYVPLALSYLGDERYGVWATISSFVSWLSLCDIGIGNGLKNNLSVSIAEGDKKRSKKLVSTAYVVIGSIVAICAILYTIIAIKVNVAKLLNISVDGDNINLALWICVAFVCLNFVIQIVSTVLYSLQKAAYTSICGVAIQGFNIIFVLLAGKLLDKSLVIAAIMLNTSTTIVWSITSLIVYKKRVDLRPAMSCFSKEEIKQIVGVGVVLFLGQISSQIMNSTDNILISRILGATDVTPYSIAYKLFTIFFTVQGVIIMPLWPAYTVAKAENNSEWIKETLMKGNMFVILLSLGAIVLAMMIDPVTKIWLGSSLYFNKIMVFVMMPYTIVYMFESNYCAFLCGASILKGYTILSVIGAMMNIPCSVLFADCFGMGLTGIILGTLVSIIPGVFVYPYITHKALENLKQ